MHWKPLNVRVIFVISLSNSRLPVKMTLSSHEHKNMATGNNVTKKKHGGKGCHIAKGSDSWCLKSPRGIWSFTLLPWGPCQNGIHGLNFQCTLEWQCAGEGVRSWFSHMTDIYWGHMHYHPALKHNGMTETSVWHSIWGDGGCIKSQSPKNLPDEQLSSVCVDVL